MSEYYSVNMTKNEEQGGAWLMHIVKKDRDGELIQEWHSSWRTPTPAKKHAVTLIGKRPKWVMNEAKTEVLGNVEVRVLAG